MTAGVRSQSEPRRTSTPPAWGKTMLASLKLMESGTRGIIAEKAATWVKVSKPSKPSKPRGGGIGSSGAAGG